MSDKELWELMSIICEGQDSEQRREVEQYITDLQKEIDRLGKLFYERNEENIRLNNIINELERYMEGKDIYKIVLYKLRDLKDSDKE